jgi:hypothetical protein
MALIVEFLRRIFLALWWLASRRERQRTARLRAKLARERRRFDATTADLEQRIRQQSADARWEEDRLNGQIAILNEQLAMYSDIVQRERQRVSAETAILARRESDARYNSGPAGGASLLAGLGE